MKRIEMMCAALLLLLASHADAQDQSDNLLDMDLQDLLQVKVDVASRFNEDQLDAASTVSSIGPTQWEQQGARTMTDALQHMPGVIVVPNWFGADQILIRGYSSSNNTNGVVQVWDGVPMNFLESRTQFTHPDIQLGTLNNIQVIRGPGSALYGENAFHGVISLQSFSADTDTLQMDTGYASNGFANASYRQSLAVTPGVRLNVSVAATGQPSQNQSYTYLLPGSGAAAASTRSLQYADETAVFRLESDKSMPWSWYAGIYVDDHNVGDAYSQGTSSDVAANDVGGVSSLFSMEQAGLVWRLDPVNSVEFKAYGYGQQRQFNRTQGPDLWLTTNGGEREYGGMMIFRHQASADETRWSLQFGAQNSQMGDYNRISTYTNGVIDQALTGPLPFEGYSRRNRNVALDAESPIPGLHDLALHWGGRYDDYSDFGSHFSPHAGLVWHPQADEAVKLLYGNAFRAPNAGEIRGLSAVLGDPSIQPETIDTYELTFMKRSEHWMNELTFYQSTWYRMISLVPVSMPGYVGQYANNGTSRSHGVEFSQTWQSGVWSCSWNASYNQSKNDSVNVDYTAFPPVMLNAMLNYHIESHAMDVSVNEHSNLDTSYTNQKALTPDPMILPDFWRTDVHLSQQLSSHFSWSIDVRNLFNHSNFLPSIQPYPSYYGLPDYSRSFWLNARYSL